jgi:hypothetical protein
MVLGRLWGSYRRLRWEIKCKFHPRIHYEWPEGSRCKLYSFFNLTARRKWVVTATYRPFYLPERDPVPILREVRCVSRPVWTSAGNLTPTGIRSPNRPARSESLYRIHYLCPRDETYCTIMKMIRRISFKVDHWQPSLWSSELWYAWVRAFQKEQHGRYQVATGINRNIL